MITLVDYHMGNLRSIVNMIVKVGGKARTSSDVAELREAEKLVLPGVGHFDRGMTNLHALGLIPVLRERVLDAKVPTLGICLGMQLMCRRSDEGGKDGLAWIDADVNRFDAVAHPRMKVPHMGWNDVKATKRSPLFDEHPVEPQRFYFVHSYYVECHDREDVIGTTNYEGEFCSSFQRDNIFGVQFHPEKSHAFGMDLFRRFLAL